MRHAIDRLNTYLAPFKHVHRCSRCAATGRAARAFRVYAERASNYAGTRQPTTARGVVRPTAKEEGEMVIPGTDSFYSTHSQNQGPSSSSRQLALSLVPQRINTCRCAQKVHSLRISTSTKGRAATKQIQLRSTSVLGNGGGSDGSRHSTAVVTIRAASQTASIVNRARSTTTVRQLWTGQASLFRSHHP
jgi:hypothetical protein